MRQRNKMIVKKETRSVRAILVRTEVYLPWE